MYPRQEVKEKETIYGLNSIAKMQYFSKKKCQLFLLYLLKLVIM